MSLHDRLGVNCHLANRHIMPLAAGLGKYARIDGNWNMVQPNNPDEWHWDVLDESIHTAVSLGLEPYLCLGKTPRWASRTGESNGPPTMIRYWTMFLTAAATRYQANVRYFGATNEPNSAGYWSGTITEYVDYIVKPMAQTLRQMNPANQICLPDLAMQGSWPSWLAPFLTQARGFYDIITVHAYAGKGRDILKKLFTPKPWWNPFATPSVWEVLEQVGCTGVPLALTEYALNSSHPEEEAQARFFDEFLEAFESEPRLVAALAFNLQDEPPSIANPHGVHGGLHRTDGTPKPAAEVIKHYASTPMI